ncbi:MAG TPA: tetratricopeptide repeat protein [Blastocatellia bacterium]|nr:tetratricopeptide repeat protein [Blastocatellia bacterium]
MRAPASTECRRWRPLAFRARLSILTGFLVLIAGFAASGNASRQQGGPQTWAVVVGVSRYPKFPGGQQLQFAEKDATTFASALVASGVPQNNVRLLTGAAATVASVKSSVGTWLPRSVNPDDFVYFFFSGHGVTEAGFDDCYLACHDSDPQNLYGTALSVNDLRYVVTQRLRARSVLVFADAMRRDFFDPEASPAPSERFVKSFDAFASSRPGVAAILANAPGEFSREGQRWGGLGVFARYLTDGVAGGADADHDGRVTVEEVFSFVSSRVAGETSNKQHPWWSGGALADVTLAQVKAARPAATSPTVAVTSKPAESVAAPPPTAPPSQAGASERQPAIENPSRPVARVEPAPNRSTQVTQGEGAAPSGRTNVERDTTNPPPTTGVEPSAAPSTGPSSSASVPRPESTTSGGGRANVPRAVSPPPKTKTNAPPAVSKTSPNTKSTTKPAVSAPPPNTKTTAPTVVYTPPRSQPVAVAGSPSSGSAPTGVVVVPESTPPPAPANIPPTPAAVATQPVTARAAGPAGAITVGEATRAPTPLLLETEVAISSGKLVEPPGSNAWDLYQRLVKDPTATTETGRLRSLLSDALVKSAKAIVLADLRSDTLAGRVDDFRRAGQMLSRAKTLRPEDASLPPLEKLSAAQALLALQFYDEAEKSLSQLQPARLAVVENGLGVAYLGMFDEFRAERAFKRASEMEPGSPGAYYNLGLLYRAQKKDEAVAMFEKAASLGPSDAAFQVACGDEYFAREKWAEATTAYRKAVALKPADDVLHTKLGHALFSQGLRDEANREYMKAKELQGKQ